MIPGPIQLLKKAGGGLVWLSWLERHPINLKLAGSIPCQGTYWVVGLIPGQGTRER